MTGLSFVVDSPSENLNYNGLTIYAVNQWGTSCSSTGDIESIATQVQLYHSGVLLGSDMSVSATGVDSCIYEILFTTTLASGSHQFDVVFDTITSAFVVDGNMISFVVDHTSFPWLQTDMGTEVVPGDISWWADGADFTTQNPGISLITNISTGASQVSYNNGYLTGFAVSINVKSVSDIILSWFTVGQIGSGKFGVGWHNVPHTITLLDTTGNILSNTTINQTGEIVFQNLNYLIPAGQTWQLHMMVSWTGSIVANGFKFQWSHWDVYDTSWHAYPYAASQPWIPIDILENTVTGLRPVTADWGSIINNPNGTYVWQMRFSSTTQSHIDQIAMINLNDPFYGMQVHSGTLACSSSSSCDNISTWWDGLTVYLIHNSQVVGSGMITSGAVLLPLSPTIPIYDQGDYIDIYIHDPDDIQQADETNKTAMLWLLNTQNILDLGWQTIETIIKADSNNNDLVANFDDDLMVYEQHRIRKSLLSVTVDPLLSWYKDIDDVMFQTWVSLLWLQLQSTWSTSYLHQLKFTHTSNNVQVDNIGLSIDWDTDPNNATCWLSTGFITCTMTGSYINGLAIGSMIHSIALTADITGWVTTGEQSIITSLISAAPLDYGMYDVSSIPVQHSIIHSDWSDPSLTTSSVNWFTDAGITLSNIALEYNGDWWQAVIEPIIITWISYQHTGSWYSFMWDAYNTGFVALQITTWWNYIPRAQVPASSWVISWVPIWTTATYNIKLIPITSTGASLWPDQIITLQHTWSTTTIILYGNANPTINLWWFFVDLGAYRDDGISSWTNVIASGQNLVNTNQLWVYPITYNYTDKFDNPATQVTRTVTVQDLTAPTITISGWDTVAIEFGSTYIDSWATATDNSTGAVIDLVGSGVVDTMTLWDYYINYEYADPSGNTGYATRTVTVQDTTPPTLQFIGDETTIIWYNGTFDDLGALWTDNKDGTGIVYTLDTVPNIIGTHLITYTHPDEAGNTATITGAVVVVDNTIPVITRNGKAIVRHEAGIPYIDSWAIYNDDVDGVWPIEASGAVDVLVPGSYLLTYNYTDKAENIGVQQTRTVIVQDTTAPAITIIGSTGMTIAHWWTYRESGATWTDAVGGSGSALVSGTVDTNTLWIYNVTYYYVDNAGNTGSAIRTVTITDQTAPVVTLNGNSIISIYSWSTYTELWATWTDNVDWSSTINPTSGSVNTNLTWTYILEYQKIDNAGNTGSVSRIVQVVDLPFCQTTNIPQTECETLITLYNSTNGWGWTNNSGWWIDTDVENWYGVTLSSGNVSSLQLFVNNLSWSIPVQISQLTKLTNLQLNKNNISGPIPTELWNLSWLNMIDLSNNNLTGTVPDFNQNLSSLNEFYVNNNQLIADSGSNAIISPWLRNILTTNSVSYNLSNNTYLPPTITLNGSRAITVVQGSSYIDSRAIYTNQIDGSTWLVIASGSVNTSITWNYTLTYDYTDIYGNAATQQSKTVSVVDTTIYLAPVWYTQNNTGSNSYTVTWNAWSWYKVNISIKDAALSWNYSTFSAVLGSVWSGIINLYTGTTYLIKLTPVDDLNTPLWPDQIMTITHTVPLITTTWSTQNTKRTSWGWWGRKTNKVLVNAGDKNNVWSLKSWVYTDEKLHWVAPNKSNINTSTSQTVTIKLGTNGEIIVVDPSKLKKPVFAKDLPRTTWSVASGDTQSPITLKPYSIITPKMLRDINLIDDSNNSWDRAPRRHKIETIYEATRDRGTTISSNFFTRLIQPLKIIMRY
jgi:hypothetical protein